MIKEKLTALSDKVIDALNLAAERFFLCRTIEINSEQMNKESGQAIWDLL